MASGDGGDKLTVIEPIKLTSNVCSESKDAVAIEPLDAFRPRSLEVDSVVLDG